MSSVQDIISPITISHYIGKIWHYPLFRIGNNYLIVGNILIALALLWIGIRYHKVLNLKIKNYIRHKSHYDKDTAHTIEKMLSYFIILVYITFVLEIAQIPISAFAFLGGAVALSIGLGAQTLINNFLSGLMVMAEKALKIGDIVEIDGVVGIVHSIGTRSTHIKTISGSEVVIPNSNFVQNIFVKLNTPKGSIRNKAVLTINDTGLDSNKLKSNILEVLGDVPHVLNHPHPEMYLVEIKNSKYKYIVYFYTNVSRYDHIESIQDQINNNLVNRWGKNDIELTYVKENTINKKE